MTAVSDARRSSEVGFYPYPSTRLNRYDGAS
jgi:hypothetical protein